MKIEIEVTTVIGGHFITAKSDAWTGQPLSGFVPKLAQAPIRIKEVVAPIFAAASKKEKE